MEKQLILIQSTYREGNEAVVIKEVVLFSADLCLDPRTIVYGEGYNMLTQYYGTAFAAETFTNYSDGGHYKIP